MTPDQMVQLASEEESKIAEAVFLNNHTRRKTAVFAAADRRTGCSWVLARVARSLAQRVRGSVCVLDANLRWPSLHELFRLNNTRGLLQALENTDSISNYAQRVADTNLWVITSGGTIEDSHSTILSADFASRFAELKSSFDFVVADTVAMKASPDAGVLGRLSDGAILVIAANSTTRDTAVATKVTLEAADVQIAGAILNKRAYPIPAKIYQYL
jgi:Mrp family chromosome partitioning ATPase